MRAQQPALTARSRVTIWCPSFRRSWPNSAFSRTQCTPTVSSPRHHRPGRKVLAPGTVAQAIAKVSQIQGQKAKRTNEKETLETITSLTVPCALTQNAAPNHKVACRSRQYQILPVSTSSQLPLNNH